MKRLAGQAGRTVGWFFHHLGMLFITVFFIVAVLFGSLAFRLSRGPMQIPWVTTLLANAVSGEDIDINVGHAALGWAGYKKGGGAPLYLELGQISVRNAEGAALASIPTARLELSLGALFDSKSSVYVTSTDARFEGADAPVSALAGIHLRHFALSEADIWVTLGAGQLGPPGLTEPLAGGKFMLTLGPKDVTLSNATLTFAPFGGSAPVIHIAGTAHRDSFWHGSLNVTGNSVQAQDLSHYWPEQLAAQTRSWVVTNIPAGTASAPNFTFTISAPGHLSNLQVDNATGSFKAQNLTLVWLPDARPMTELEGSFTLTDPDDIDIAADSAKLGGINISHATMHIGGVAHRDQTGTLNIPISGTVQNTFAVLNEKPLNLLKTVPPPVVDASGNMTGTIAAVLPFKKKVLISDVALKVNAMLTDVAILLPIDGLALTQGSLAVMSTMQDLDVHGDATLAGEPAHITVIANYGPPKKPGWMKLEMKTAITAKTLTALKLDPNAEITGAMPLDIRIATTPANTGSVTVSADLTEAALKLPVFGWSKPAGRPGNFSFAASMDGQNFSGISRIDSIDAKAPGLDIETQAAGGAIDVTRIHIGDTDGSGRIVPPANVKAPWDIKVTGNMLDASAAINPPVMTKGKAEPPKVIKPVSVPAAHVAPSGFLWRATAHFDHLQLAVPPASGLSDFNFTGNGQGGSVLDASSNAMLSSGQAVNLEITPAGLPVAGDPAAVIPPGGTERLKLQTGDGGELLRALGAFDNLKGGSLNFTASYGEAPFAGTIAINKFRLLNAPGFAKFLQAITVLGIPEAASGPGLEFSKLIAPFSVESGILTLKGSRAYSASLGFTASGTVDFDAGIYDIHGTVVPAYALNALPGKIPLIGKLFSPEKGGGLFAMGYSMTGSTADPKIKVNPLSALTPGFLRGIFGIGRDLETK